MTLQAVRARRTLIEGRLVPATVILAGARIAAIEPFEYVVTGDAGDVLEAPDSAVVLPGIVDTHVHVNEPGRTAWEGFATATTAAALGGVTTLLDMPLNSIPPTTTVAGLQAKRAAAAGQLAVDVGFWGGAVPGNLGDLEPLRAAGVFGFKCFLAPSGVDEFPPLAPEEFTSALRELARIDALMIVHAEDAGVLEAAPAPPSRAYADFLISRPDAAETRAISQVLDGARETGARVHVLHLSSARALDVLADARAEGLAVTVETCPHYLCFESDAIPDASPQYKCCPPIRDAGNRAALWQALVDGLIDIVVTDHSPATPEEKGRGDGDLQQAWGGIAGLQVGFTAVAAEAARQGIGIEQVSRWMSTSSADLVGLGAKGRISPGSDADFVVYDSASPMQVDVARLAHKNPISAYDGQRYDASVTATVLGGVLVDRAAPDLDRGRQLLAIRRP